MIWWALLAVPLLASWCAGRIAMPVARRARPAHAAAVLTASSVVLAASSVVSVAIVGFVSVARVGPVAAFAHWTRPLPSGSIAPPIWFALLVLALAGVVGTQVARHIGALVHQMRNANALRLDATGPIVSVADGDAYAFACRPNPFRPGVIVISSGLRASLQADELEAVLAHESAHVDGLHLQQRQVGRLMAAVNPLLAPLNDAIEFSLERAADERAANRTSRETAARALARSALHTRTGGAHAMGHSTNHVVQRVEALLVAPPRRSAALAVVVVTAAAATVAVLLAAHQTELLIEAIRQTHA